MASSASAESKSVQSEPRSGTLRQAGSLAVASPTSSPTAQSKPSLPSSTASPKRSALREVGFFDESVLARRRDRLDSRVSLSSCDGFADISPTMKSRRSQDSPTMTHSKAGDVDYSEADFEMMTSKTTASSLSEGPSSPKSPKKVNFGRAQTNDVPSSAPVRRTSLPCLKVKTGKGQPGSAGSGSDDKVVCRQGVDGKRILERRVSFGDGTELFEAFTPYSKKYGVHPDDFFFDAEGHMVLSSSCSNTDLLEVKSNDVLECIIDRGVDHFTKPQHMARMAKPKTVLLGEEVLVKKRCGEWVEDSTGWLPLSLNGKLAFQVMVPKEKLKYATSCVAVMSSCAVEESTSV